MPTLQSSSAAVKSGCTSDASRPHLSVVIPTFNEETRILRTLEDVDAYLSAQPFWSEILLVDDGSTDRTKSIVEARMGTMKRLRLLEGRAIAAKDGPSARAC
jgi:cellulose synthase/poly-beta-1,6-N-acetylglucosamine synthase-like glycosyltransferase